jgi:hypothetical protein
MRRLQDLTLAKRKQGPKQGYGQAHRLVLDSMIFQAEAEQRWLDHCEALLTTATHSPQEEQR